MLAACSSPFQEQRTVPMATPSTSFHRDTTADEVLAGIDLHGKTYLITGGTSGLGQETARALAARVRPSAW
jgi:hypothetical protein